MRIEFLTPRRSCVREQDIDMISRLRHFRHETLDIGNLSAVGGNRYCARTRPLVGQSVQSGAGGVARGGFAGGYVDFGTACLHKSASNLFSFGRSRM